MEVDGCSCEWAPANGFDGFAMVTAAASLAYAVVLGISACFGVAGPRITPSAETSGAVEPLEASAVARAACRDDDVGDAPINSLTKGAA